MKPPRLVDPPDTLSVRALRSNANQIAMLYYGAPVYLVGGALFETDPRDLDVVVILSDEMFLYTYGDHEHTTPPKGMRRETRLRGMVCHVSCQAYALAPEPIWRRWARDCLKWNARLTKAAHRRVDFKTQAETLVRMHFEDKPRARLDTLT